MRLIRKVTLAKWRSVDSASPQAIPADAICIDLKTQNNTLSVWKVEENVPSAEENAVLALLGSQDRIETIDIVCLEASEIPDVPVAYLPGKTCAHSLRHLHVDLSELNHKLLCATAEVLAHKIYSQSVTRLRRSEVKDRLAKALAAGMLDASVMHDSMRSELGVLPPASP